MNYIDILQSERTISSKATNIIVILLASWLIGVSAQFSIVLPFSPVPITGQTIIILMNRNIFTGGALIYLLQSTSAPMK